MMSKIKNIILFAIILILLVFTRYVNISWGFPYLFHPDERNIVVSLEQFQCPNILNFKECLNPHFFAYGQFFPYLGYFFKLITHTSSFSDLVLILRFLSTVFSIFSVYVGFLIIKELTEGYIKKYSKHTIEFGGLMTLIFSPALIQIAHFGTTESILAFFYAVQTYISILFIRKKINPFNFLTGSSVILGLSVATKVSSLIFLFVPLIALFLAKEVKVKKKILYFLHITFFTFVTALIFSPHYLISYKEFLSSLNYESAVALGRIKVFYTRQFEMSVPIVFQVFKIFPYALGIPAFIFFIFGTLFLPKKIEFNFLKLAFFSYFIPTSFLYAKWTRFMAPVFLLMIVVSYIFLLNLFSKYIKSESFRKIFFWISILIIIIPGVLFANVYLKSDTRVQASNWIIKKIPNNSLILSETGNVVDIPVGDRKGNNYEVISFNLYDIDSDSELYSRLLKDIERADYIIVPSRRIFASHNKKLFPKVNKYYEDLFNDKLGFKKVAEFKTLNDEFAEETFSVFDHPVVRIYKRI